MIDPNARAGSLYKTLKVSVQWWIHGGIRVIYPPPPSIKKAHFVVVNLFFLVKEKYYCNLSPPPQERNIVSWIRPKLKILRVSEEPPGAHRSN